MTVSPHSLFDNPSGGPELAGGLRLGRNWYRTAGDGWSSAPECSLVFEAQAFAEPVPMLLDIAVFNARPGDPRMVQIDSPGHPPVTLRVDSPATVPVLVHSPRHAPGALCSEMTLRIDRIASPSQLGMSTDDRLLGLRVLGALRHDAAVAFPLGMAHPAVADICCAEGWAPPEAGGVWSIAPVSRLILPRVLRCDAAVLGFDLSVLPRPDGAPPLGVTLEVDGRVMARAGFHAAPPGPWLCPLRGGWQVGEPLELTFRLADLRTPQDLGINVDTRPLGVFLRRIVLDPD